MFERDKHLFRSTSFPVIQTWEIYACRQCKQDLKIKFIGMDMDQKIDRSIGFHEVMHAKPYLHLCSVFYTDKKGKE